MTKKACSCAPWRHGLLTSPDHFLCHFIPFLIRKMILPICSNMRPMYKSQQSESHSIPWFVGRSKPTCLEILIWDILKLGGSPHGFRNTSDILWVINHFLTIMDASPSTTVTIPELCWDGPSWPQNTPLCLSSPSRPSRKDPASKVNQ